MLQLISRQLRIFGFLLPFGLAAQNKTELTTTVEPAAAFTVFTNEVFGAYPFQLPASGDLQLVREQSMLLQANVKNHRLHGAWASYYPQSQKMDEGMLVKGVPDGAWKTWYPNGQLKSVRSYNADLFFKIQADIDLNHPKISRFILSERYKKEGKKVLQVLSANYSFRIHQKTIPADLALLVAQNQQQPAHYHPPFKNALHHGLYMNYYENGAVQDSGYYNQGLRNGLWEHHLADGTFWRGLYKNGTRINDWKYYTAEGKVQLFILYDEKGNELRRKQL